jgi:hypothetical protein
MDGSLSTLAPIFAVVLATHEPRTALFTGLATALGAGVSMAFSEGLSDTTLTGQPVRSRRHHGRRNVRRRRLPHAAVPDLSYRVAIVVVAVKLVLLAALRSVFLRPSFASSFVSVSQGGAIIASLSAALGVAAG